MAQYSNKGYGGYNQSRQNDYQRQGFQNSKSGGQYANTEKYTPKALSLPVDYVDEAARLMEKCHSYISSSKLRNILSMVSNIYNSERVGGELLSEASRNSLQMLRVRIIYEYGRNDNSFKEFIAQTHILDHLLAVGNDRGRFIDYAHYLEAIVAYHKFYGDK